MISVQTGLTEAQVYKWGWDQKRKKYGVQEAERMRKIEHMIDQENMKNKQMETKRRRIELRLAKMN
jgi:hypothetical protein